MQARLLLPDSQKLVCESVTLDRDMVEVIVSGVASCAECPSCGRSSERIHSRYVRRLADLPWQGLRVEIRWRNRRFFCTNSSCSQRIFSERIRDVAAPFARKTGRLSLVMRAVALACGGEQGSRLTDRLGIRTSADTLLREIRRSTLPPSANVRVVGVDDWALRRGQRYGTILVDLEKHRVVDLLPERSSEALEAWLRRHPEVEIVSRDRGDYYYIKGADAGAPRAKQVADRWHLIHNLHEALLRFVEHFPKELKDVSSRVGRQLVEASSEHVDAHQNVATRRKTQTKLEAARNERRARRASRYQQAIDLHRQSIPQVEIARRLGLHRSTVRQWIRAGCFPERAARYFPNGINSWTDYLQERWKAGCHNAAALTPELRARGFKGSYHMVRRLLGKWRTHSGLRVTRSKPPTSSPRSMAWLLFKAPPEREPEQNRLVQAFYEACPQVEKAVQVVQQFRAFVRERKIDGLRTWLSKAIWTEAPTELQRFAAGIKADLAAVEAALSLPWSNGQTEGQVNRLKFIKRQMYGRANFDLLRKRVLTHAT